MSHSLKHTHMYERVGSRQRPKFWRCAHPDCTHTLSCLLIPGKRSMCNCGETFILDAGALQRKRPKCVNCRNTAESRKMAAATSILDTLFKDNMDQPLVVKGDD